MRAIRALKGISQLRFALDKNQHCCLFLTTKGVNGVVANQREVGGAFE
jgi:hypothetical protein